MEEVGKILPKVFQPQLSRLESPVVEVLAPLWGRVAGKALARECRPVAFSAGTLTVAAEDPDWVESLRQIAEEIRTRVNSFLGKPVVKRLRILSACEPAYRNTPHGQPEDLLVSGSGPRDWPHHRAGMASAAPQIIGRSRVKCFTRKRGKAL